MIKIAIITAAAVLMSGAANAAVLTEDFEGAFPAWESGWFGTNSTAQNCYGVGQGRGNNPDGLWIAGAGQGCNSSPVTVTFGAGFAATLTSLSFDVAGFTPTTLSFFDKDGALLNAFNVTLTSGALTDPGVYVNYGTNSTNGIGGFSFTGAAAGNTSIDNIIANGSVVPEPASWAMLIAGFGLTGAAMRRRRVAVAA